jgi:hypothetical protein
VAMLVDAFFVAVFGASLFSKIEVGWQLCSIAVTIVSRVGKVVFDVRRGFLSNRSA